MINKELIKQARERLPDPKEVEGNYIDIELANDSGQKWVVSFTKAISDGEVVWMDLPEAR
ncbi:hypothetical protein [Mucilaginibacter sp. KACC 22063]|uniref:hypothetical protein n=1 Tax=Mucilaginibacter sp. KACC 22063 TaxID=3025666 RepID=UPI002366ABEA|nr:hypothetical protein [Mucilaginibacter sp. KACC 22063]WDF55986.1 hypothetical protein PQ461_02795 [Mucilaginibacter sp. KACC 22063]